MAKKGGGSIINMSSGGATQAHRSFTAYDASKGGIEALTRAMALDLGPYNIRVNALMPGSIDTAGLDEDERALRGVNIPSGRIGDPYDMTGPALFLASEDSAYVTGDVIKVDGGMLAQQRSATVDIVRPTRSRRSTTSEPVPEPRTGGQIVADALVAHGVSHAFGVPGESYLAVLDALHDTDITYVICRQEGGAAYMAEAWGRLTGDPGVCMVTRGPGATNASVGIHAARENSQPMVVLIGQVATARDRTGGVPGDRLPALPRPDHQVGHPGRRRRRTRRDPARYAFKIATSGRPGPVAVALPEDMLRAHDHGHRRDPARDRSGHPDHRRDRRDRRRARRRRAAR